MSNEIDSIVLDHLRHIRGVVDRLDHRVDSVEMRLAAIEQHPAGFHLTVTTHSDNVSALRRQVDRIE